MKKLKNEISVFIVSKNRKKELDRLLNSLSRSAKDVQLKIKIFLGIEKFSYKNIKSYKNLDIKKIYFKKNCSPVKIKNYLYKSSISKIRIFLDDDTEVNKIFFFKILENYKRNKNCFLKITPVSFFSTPKRKIYLTKMLEFVAFAEFGKKKLKLLSNLNFVAEDTEVSNRLNMNNIKIFEDNHLQVIHHISKKNRNLNRLEQNGINNTIEICRYYGAIKNFWIIYDLILKSLISIIFYGKLRLIKIIIKKTISSKLGIKFFYEKKTVIPPYKNYFFNEGKNNMRSLGKCKKIDFDRLTICRTSTFENYQILEKKFYDATYVGPKTDKEKIIKNFKFSKSNISNNTFLNLSKYLNVNKNNTKNIILTLDSNNLKTELIYQKISSKYFNVCINKPHNFYVFVNRKLYSFNRRDYLNFQFYLSIKLIPIYILSFLISILLILPIKLKSNN